MFWIGTLCAIFFAGAANYLLEGRFMTSMQITNFVLREQLEKIVQDSYIKKCIGQAEIPEIFIEMLEILFSNHPFEATKKNRLGIAAILLQMGLEMHNRVSIDEKPTPTEMKIRQQRVLAGDYYSSLFYYLLAQKHDFQLIRYFSQQVLIINEAKLSLHIRLINQSEYDQEMLSYLKIITSRLLVAVADFIHLQDEFIFLWKKTVSLCLLIMDLTKSREWEKFSLPVRLQIYQEWSDLIANIRNMSKEKSKRQLLAILRRHEAFIEKIAVKES